MLIYTSPNWSTTRRGNSSLHAASYRPGSRVYLSSSSDDLRCLPIEIREEGEGATWQERTPVARLHTHMYDNVGDLA
jgi:hypothetical protein